MVESLRLRWLNLFAIKADFCSVVLGYRFCF